MQKTLQSVLVGMAAMSGLTVLPTIKITQNLNPVWGPGGTGGLRSCDQYERYDRRPRGCPWEALDIARGEGSAEHRSSG